MEIEKEGEGESGKKKGEGETSKRGGRETEKREVWKEKLDGFLLSWAFRLNVSKLFSCTRFLSSSTVAAVVLSVSCLFLQGRKYIWSASFGSYFNESLQQQF